MRQRDSRGVGCRRGWGRRGGLALAALGLAAGAALVMARAQAPPDGAAVEITPARKVALDAISADSMRGHLSFLASDLLEGRDTPSRGLDLAAEYIAAQFRRAGLQPAGDDGYFQTARWKIVEPDPATFRCELAVGGKTIAVPIDHVRLSGTGPIAVAAAPLARLAEPTPAAVDALAEADVAGKAFVIAPAFPEGADAPARQKLLRDLTGAVSRLGTKKAAAVVVLDPRAPQAGTGLPRGRLVDPEAPEFSLNLAPRRQPVVTLHDPAAIEALAAADAPEGATLTLTLGPPVERPVVLRNVAALLPGSDPALKDECVIVSSHYDHLGVGGSGEDRIFNGANDDGSGTTMVVELAGALAKLDPAPKRSVLFLCFYGEEKGLLGSRYYGRHPIVPLARTVAMVNLEHVGRTDDSEDGPQPGRASLTGFDFSEVGDVLARAGRATGVEVFKHPRNSDSFFGRSDNQSLADAGVPAHTLCTAFLFPEYHQAGDHWDKVDYANMERVGRTVALGVLELADAPGRPRWNEANPRAARYAKAARALADGPAADATP